MVEVDEQHLKSGLMAQKLSFQLRCLLTLLADRVSVAHQPFGLRGGSFTTLALIAANPGCSQIELSRVGGLDRSLLVAIVDELEQRGLAVRKRSAIDRRRSSLYITDEGEAVMNEMFAAAIDSEKPIRDNFSEQEMAEFFNYVSRAQELLAREETLSERAVIL